MILAVDIGNTSMVFGVFNGPKLVLTWRSEPDPKRSIKELSREINELFVSKGISPGDISAAVVSSVVPKADGMLSGLCRGLFGVEPRFVSADDIGELKIIPANKHEIGADRLVNAFAAYRLYGSPVIIVDFGTAATFCAVSKRGEYLGGAIAPGVAMARDALHERTAKLPRIDIEFPNRTIARDTMNAMRSGLFFGYIAMAEGMIKRFKKELKGRAKVIATGGFAALIQSRLKIFDVVDQDLTLKGLRLIWEDLNVGRT